MKLTKEQKISLKNKLKKINKLYREIDHITGSLSSEEDAQIIRFHNEHTTLQHCTRWGLQGTRELLDNFKELVKMIEGEE
jgi:5-methylcytosine-specific restriction endonuclease McrBC regulatory subunit McrC